ncbi:splicing factor, arginine/serine-rich 16 [Mytilus galloprovincialis]|uniref:Splicing factor, arginine/serine-rich 16 n=1 Tax=Mytilus galloprovincialis TaxID=29158 RepID=A0A8B6CMJ9_MYTGA|nr:splicing factor, arginine/serine-rich 16 [Mytilus galloprovincialis]
MWQEARKQEKKIRGLMVDYKKRAERRREFYEKIKLDPAQFVRAYGRPCKINLDPAVAYAAESPQSMMPWQGQEDNMIDRFDVRAHLDYMPQTKIVAPPTLSKREEEEERSINYERYRIIVENECAGLTEEQALYQIYVDEQFGNVDKSKDEEKKKLEGKKAAIAFVYEDSTPVLKDDDDSESSDTDVEDVDLGDKTVNGDKDSIENGGDETEEDPEITYDKNKSFFDNISCEATERAKGRTTRTSWKEERKLNTETFGMQDRRNFASRGYGGYRGYNRGYNRGGYYNDRGSRGYSRGGAGGGGFRGQSRPPRGGGYGGGNRNRSQGWVDYNYDYEAAGLDKRQGSANRQRQTTTAES